MKTYTKYFLYAIGFLFVLSIAANIYQKFNPPPVKPTTTTLTKIDTSKIIKKFEGELRAKLEAELKPKLVTIKVKEKVNVDSIYAAAKKYWHDKLIAEHKDTTENYDYVASFDTSYVRDKDTLATQKTEYHSPIPLSPSGYFHTYFSWSNLQINHTTETTITKPPHIGWLQSIINRFHYSIQTGAGIGVFTHQFDIYVGFGISYNL
jgi:hypothetical protein